MFKRLKMGTKIGGGFGVIILIAATLGFVGWNGVSSVKSYMTEYAKWGDIDMVMNEGVIANALKLQTAAHDYSADSSEENWNRFIAAQKASKDGLAEWRSVLAGEAKMEEAAAKIDDYFGSYANLGNNYHKEVVTMQKLKQQVDSSVNTLFVALEDAMENIIDPAKEAQVMPPHPPISSL